MHINVRRATQAEVTAVLACLAAAFEPYRGAYTANAFEDTIPPIDDLRRRFAEMTVLVAAATPAGIIGTIAHQIVAAREGHLRGLAVVPAFQGRGVAERLLLAAENDLRDLGCARVTLDTTRPLARAIAFYQRHGYRSTGIVKDFFGMPLYEYEKDLVPRWPKVHHEA